jgi:hypothetical protein
MIASIFFMGTPASFRGRTAECLPRSVIAAHSINHAVPPRRSDASGSSFSGSPPKQLKGEAYNGHKMCNCRANDLKLQGK